MGHLFTQRETVDSQIAADEAAIEAWEAAFAAAGGDIRLAGMEIPYVRMVDLDKPENSWNMTWLGKGPIRPKIVVPLPDGRPFRAVGLGLFATDRTRLRRGHPDPSGQAYGPFSLKFRYVNADGEICRSGADYNRRPLSRQLVAHTCLNQFDDRDMTDEEFLDLLFNLNLDVCTFTNNPQVTLRPEEYAAFMAGHPDFEWLGYTRILPWIPEAA